MAKEGGWNPLRVLNTSRPFTPQAAGRDGRRRGKGNNNSKIAAGDLPRLVIKEEDEETHESRSSMQDIRLPQISQTKVIVRKQFRRQSNSKDRNQEDEDDDDDDRKDKKSAEEELDPFDACQQMLQVLLSRSDNDHECEDDSDRVERTVILQADKLLMSLWEKKMKLPRACFLPLSKIMFLLSSDDDNDRFLCGTSLLANYVEQALGQMDLSEDAEAALNSYGMLKLVSHNQDLLEALCLHGLVPLILLHLKILCQDRNVKLGKNVAFQMTACLRNCLNNRTGQEEFRSCGGVETLDAVTAAFSASKEISCNLARLYSVLSQLPMVQDQFSAASVDALYLMVKQHANSDELMVRTAFALGNIAAYDDLGRKILLDRHDLLECLIGVLDSKSMTATTTSSDDKLTEDILVKSVRVFANLAVLKEGGQWAAVNDGLVKALIRLLERKTAKTESEEEDNYLLLSTLSAVCNLSYYPMVRYCQLLECVLPHVLDNGDGDAGMAAEAARVVGNLSRITSVRSQLSTKDTLGQLMGIADDYNEPDDYARRDLRYNLTYRYIVGYIICNSVYSTDSIKVTNVRKVLILIPLVGLLSLELSSISWWTPS